MTYNGYKLKCDYSVSEAIGIIIIWIIISFFTLGLGLFVMPYYVLKGPINKTTLINENGEKVGQLHVDVHLPEIIGHMIIWVLLTIVTFGFAFFIYYPAVVKRLLNGVQIR
ncbi:MAG: hypothetical protein JKY77_02975 [Rhizobiaceae bacterium]|nr:hypothetical protein [Rhizobiaceae bacterium]